MYRWKKKEIKNLINILKNKNPINTAEKEEIELYINKLYSLLNKQRDNENFIEEENFEYEELTTYNNLLTPIIEKYINEEIEFIKYNPIISTKKNIIHISKEIIKEINPIWYNLLRPNLDYETTIDFKHGNDNYLHNIEYLNKVFIELSRQYNIEDYLNPIHEFFHLLTIIINKKHFETIECEFLSILGELILCYELKQLNIHNKEFTKIELNTYSYILNTIKNITLRRAVINAGFTSEQKIQFIKETYNFTNNEIQDIYNCSLTYSYSNVISYFIALELLEIYKTDKNKFINLCESIIRDNNILEKKLKTNNLTLLNNDDKYIKTLKKEYATYNQ